MAGLQFPANEKGERSTTSFNKEVYAAMANSLGAKELEEKLKSEKDWRHKYAQYLDQIVESTMKLQDTAVLQAVLTKGLEKARQMDFEPSGSSAVPLQQAMMASATKFTTSKVVGSGAAKSSLQLPYNGQQLQGAQLEEQCDRWSTYGTMEPDCAAAIKSGAKKMGEMKGRTFLVLGAGSELGPVRPLLEAGATVCAVATRRPKRWAELIAFAKKSAGTLLLPVYPGQVVNNDEDLAAVAGADLLTETPQIAEWLLRCGREAAGQVTMGTYLYADGEANVRLTVASDYIIEAVKSLGKDKVSFAYLSSCSTSTAIPKEAVEAQEANFQSAGRWAAMFGERHNCKKLDETSFFLTAFEVLQGPNYALAQMMRQWRAALLYMEGFTVSAPMAPVCRTESVVHNATMAVILEGIAHFPPQESYDAETGRMAMFALLISDLTEPMPKLSSPLRVVTRKAFHSGIWRTPFVMASLGKTTWFLGKVAPKKTA